MRARLTMMAALAVFLLGAQAPVRTAEAPRAWTGGAPRAKREVTIDNFTFGKDAVVVAPGTEVTWVNRDDMPHTVVADDKSFSSPPLDTGDRFSHTFDKPGTYDYYCSLHPKMTGRVVVE